jgi:hypothetical protein
MICAWQEKAFTQPGPGGARRRSRTLASLINRSVVAAQGPSVLSIRHDSSDWIHATPQR